MHTILLIILITGLIISSSSYITCKISLHKRDEECIQLKKELEFVKSQNKALSREVRDEKNKNIIMESLLKQKKK